MQRTYDTEQIQVLACNLRGLAFTVEDGLRPSTQRHQHFSVFDDSISTCYMYLTSELWTNLTVVEIGFPMI